MVPAHSKELVHNMKQTLYTLFEITISLWQIANRYDNLKLVLIPDTHLTGSTEQQEKGRMSVSLGEARTANIQV